MYKISLYDIIMKFFLLPWFFKFSYRKSILWKLNMARFWDRSETLTYIADSPTRRQNCNTGSIVVWTFGPYRCPFLQCWCKIRSVKKYFRILSFSKNGPWWFQKTPSQKITSANVSVDNFDATCMCTARACNLWAWQWQQTSLSFRIWWTLGGIPCL